MEVEDIILDVFWCDQPSSSRRSNCQPVTMWIVTNVWISLILLLASGWSWSVSECHVSAVAAVGPAHEYSTVFISLAAARMHALLALGPFATVRSPSAGTCWPLLSLEASLFRKSRKCDKRRDICGDFIQSPLLSVNTSDWVLVCPLSNAENVT